MTSPPPLYPFRALRPSLDHFRPQDILLRMEHYYSTLKTRTPHEGWGRFFLEFLKDAEARGAEVTTRHWLQGGLLQQDPTPGFYLHEHTFELFGQRYTRRGLLALYRLGLDLLYPHENTFPEGVRFHLRLLETTRKQFAPVMVIYPGDPYQPGDLQPQGLPLFQGTDVFGHMHTFWRVQVPGHRLRAVTWSEMVLADGHHRVEAAVAYARTHHFPFLLIELIPYGDPALFVLPTHRVAYGVDLEVLRRRCRGCFEIVRLPEEKVSPRAVVLRELRQSVVLVLPTGTYLLKPLEALDPHMAHLPAEFRQIPVYILHDFLLKYLNPRRLEYVREVREVFEKVRNGPADAGFILPAMAPETIARIAWKGLTLPQKSTDFYPKLVAGPVILHLSEEMVGT